MTYRVCTGRQSGIKFVDCRPENWPLSGVEREHPDSGGQLNWNDEDGAVGCAGNGVRIEIADGIGHRFTVGLVSSISISEYPTKGEAQERLN